MASDSVFFPLPKRPPRTKKLGDLTSDADYWYVLRDLRGNLSQRGAGPRLLSPKYRLNIRTTRAPTDSELLVAIARDAPQLVADQPPWTDPKWSITRTGGASGTAPSKQIMVRYDRIRRFVVEPGWYAFEDDEWRDWKENYQEEERDRREASMGAVDGYPLTICDQFGAPIGAIWIRGA